MTKGHNIYKKDLDIDSTMLEVVNVRRVIWIILIYKYKLYQQINEPNHGKGVVIIYLPTSIFGLDWLFAHTHRNFSALFCFTKGSFSKRANLGCEH